jgi:glycosyltransferase involved in cell wall biosynthesis
MRNGMPEERSVDLLLSTYNRLSYAVETAHAVLDNTDWKYVRQMTCIDDGSTDGTREMVHAEMQRCPVPVKHMDTRHGLPVQVMIDWIRQADAPLLAKCDSDAIYPPHWLELSLGVMDRSPQLEMLGIEAMQELALNGQPRGYAPALWASGLGIYRRPAFERCGLPPLIKKYWGLEEWQAHHGIKAGWISPSMPVFLLDRLPLAPWCDLGKEYIAKGWQRPWQMYKPEQSQLWDWWLK